MLLAYSICGGGLLMKQSKRSLVLVIVILSYKPRFQAAFSYDFEQTILILPLHGKRWEKAG
jgi:hypothetical protein